jgi:hypothetical protein
MKYIKMLGLLAVAAAALMAFAGTASAVQLTSPAGTTYTGKIKASSTDSVLHGSFTSVSCAEAGVEGEVESHGGSTVSGPIKTLSFGDCTGGEVTTVKNAGTLSINSKGEVFSTGAEVKVHTSVGECIFTTSGTKVGTFTSSPTSTSHATMSMSSASIPRTGGSFFCGSSGVWTGSYTVTSPVPLILD